MYVYMCVCEFTRMMYDHQLFTCTHRAIAVAAVAMLCSVVCCSHTCSCYCSCFVRLVAQLLPLLSLSMLLVWLVVVLLLLLVLGFLRFLSLQSSFSLLVLLSSCRAVFTMLLQTGAFPMLLLLLWYYCYYY